MNRIFGSSRTSYNCDFIIFVVKQKLLMSPIAYRFIGMITKLEILVFHDKAQYLLFHKGHYYAIYNLLCKPKFELCPFLNSGQKYIVRPEHNHCIQ